MRVKQSLGGSLSRLCLLSGYSRQAYYKQCILREEQPLREDLVVQQVMGYRRLQPHIGGKKLYPMVKPFMNSHRLDMGRDKFLRLLAKYGLQNIRRRRDKPRTTNSNHRMKKYPDLIKEWAPTHSDQLWVSDITYLQLVRGDAFLSLVTDAWSRKVVGFHLNEDLKTEGCIKALEMAVSGCSNTQGLIHHSDRGSQYCCKEYVDILKDNKILISMTQSGDPRDNAVAERVNGILKTELLKPVFENLDTARSAVEQAINTYNYLRPHSSISMLAPALVHGRTIKVKRCWKNYYKKTGGVHNDPNVIHNDSHDLKRKKEAKKENVLTSG